MLLQRVDERYLAHVLGQVAFFDQAPQGVSGCGFGVSEDGGGFFDGNLGGAGYPIHALQKFGLIGSQLVLGEGGIDHALLKDIQHVADERGEVQPFAVGILDGFLGILQGAVITMDGIVDGVGKGQALHLLPACVVQGGSIDDPGGPAVAVTEGVDIDKVEMGNKGANQTLILLPEPEPLLHQIGEPFRSSRRVDSSGSTADFNHSGPVGLSVEMSVLADTLCDFFPEGTQILLGDGATVGIIASPGGVDNHLFILGLRVAEIQFDLL